MSLLNQMLSDLDARRAIPGDAAGVPAAVRAVHVAHAAAPARRRRWLLLLLLAGGGVLALGGTRWWLATARAPAGASVAALPAPPARPSAPPASVMPDTPPPPPSAVAAPVQQPADALAAPAAGRPAPLSAEVEPRLRLSPLVSARPAAAEALAPPGVAAARPAAGGLIDKQERPPEPRERAEKLYRQALAMVNRGRHEEALELLRMALREDATHQPARQVLVKLLLDGRALPAAAAVLEEGLRALPTQSDWPLLLGRVQVEAGEPAAALATLERFLDHAGGRADYQGALAAVLFRLGRHAEAEARYAAALRSEVANGRWWVGLGMAQEALGKGSEAQESFTKALSAPGLSGELRAYAESRLR